jgi:hypothetical protein
MCRDRDHSTLIVENGRGGRAIVSDHIDTIYLAVGDSGGSRAMFLDPAQACSLAGEMIAGAARILARQFIKRVGSP